MPLPRPAVLAVLAALPGSLPAQGDVEAHRATAAESSAIRRSAERAARSFEQQRLRLLPNVPSSGSSVGDVTIGRYRYAAGEADKLTPPPAEPAAIAEARRSLLLTLDSASRATPGDAWIRGRLVWYSIEAGDMARATSAARGCRDDELPWWCYALLGLALHASHDFVGAERAFERGLAAMPDSTRCRWIDTSPLLDGEAQKIVRRTPCEQRATLDERLWWLADPLHSVDGNELRSEHFARRAFAVLHDRWRASHPLGWGADMREIVLRYAWSVAWSRDRASEGSPMQPSFSIALTGHEPNPAYDFFPDARALESPYETSDASWRLKRSLATTHYAHPFAAPMRSLRHQIAHFRRGDSLLVVAAWDARDDTLFNRGARAAVIVSSHDGRARFAERSETASVTGQLMLAVPYDDYLVSLELFATDSRAVARARAGLRTSTHVSDVGLSDILLLEPGDRPRTLDEALRRLLPDGRLGADRRVTLYWEVYGAGAVHAPRVTVNVSRVRASRARRLAEKLKLRNQPHSVEIQWETDAPAGRTTTGSVTLDLRDRPPGTWRVSITVTGPTGGTASAARDLVIEAR
jgi:hypothetical protein